MPPGIGYSYQPGREQDTQLQRNGNGGPATTVPQQAIRTLSLRVPQTTSVPGVAPLPLLNATGGGGTDLDMLLQALLKAFGPNALNTGGPGRNNTPPRIRPPFEDPNMPIDFESLASQIPPDRMAELARRTGGNTGIGNTGRGPMGPMEPVGGGPQPNQFPNIQPLF